MTTKKCIKEKDPDAILDYGFRWTKWLDGDTINGSTWIVPDGITKDSDGYTNVLTWIWLSGGTSKQVYTLVNRITTVGGRTQDKVLKIVML